MLKVVKGTNQGVDMLIMNEWKMMLHVDAASVGK